MPNSSYRLLRFCLALSYLGVKLDRPLTFHDYSAVLCKKLSLSVLQRGFVRSKWVAGTKTLRTAAPSLVYSAAEYCAPIWCCSAHTRLIDSVQNGALRIVTGCLRSTPADYLLILSGIYPADLRRLAATLSLAYTMDSRTIRCMVFQVGPQMLAKRD